MPKASAISRASHGGCSVASVPTLRLFASAREAAGTGTDFVDGATVAEVLQAARQRYGTHFAEVLTTCRVWVNGDDVG